VRKFAQSNIYRTFISLQRSRVNTKNMAPRFEVKSGKGMKFFAYNELCKVIGYYLGFGFGVWDNKVGAFIIFNTQKKANENHPTLYKIKSTVKSIVIDMNKPEYSIIENEYPLFYAKQWEEIQK